MSDARSDRSTAEEEEVILATVQSLLDTVANRDKEGMSEILIPEGCATQSRDHQISYTRLQDFPEKIPGGTERLEERFYNPLVRVDDDIAMVWAQYDFLVGGEVHHWGTNILSFRPSVHASLRHVSRTAAAPVTSMAITFTKG
jgi:hypothetical protein